MSGGTANPTGLTRIVSHAKVDEAIGYFKQDGTSVRKLCSTYTNSKTWLYEKIHFVNASPDGKIVMWGSNFGINGGRVDIVMAEVPLA
jgi:hypothetical protein